VGSRAYGGGFPFFIQIFIPQKLKQDETEGRFLRISPVSTKQLESFAK
jgi:hypothetical protein